MKGVLTSIFLVSGLLVLFFLLNYKKWNKNTGKRSGKGNIEEKRKLLDSFLLLPFPPCFWAPSLVQAKHEDLKSFRLISIYCGVITSSLKEGSLTALILKERAGGDACSEACGRELSAQETAGARRLGALMYQDNVVAAKRPN